MKKWLIFEICTLVAVLAIAIWVFATMTTGGDLPEVPQTPPQTTQETVPETTEETLGWMTFPADRELTAQQAFVYNVNTREFTFLLGEKTDRVYPASITKLFTAYVALQFLEADQVITAGDVLDMVGYGSSVAGIEKGNALTVGMLVQAMMLPSGNDAAYILADAAGRVIAEDPQIGAGSAVTAFLQEMNGQARALGLKNTQFANPDGYHSPDHYTTFADLAIIAEKVLENEVITYCTQMSKETVKFATGEKKDWENTNFLVVPESQYYCPIATGLKTGQTPSAGSCLLSAFSEDGQQWVIGVFGCPDIPDRFEDTLQLLNQTLGITQED